MGLPPNVFVQIVHESDQVYGNASYAANGVRAIAGLQAFRNYAWMTDTQAFNTVGNFRGMVVSARWATTYQVISPVANAVGNVATVASLAANAIALAPQFEAVYASTDNPAIKGLRYTSLAGTVAQRTLAGIITGGVHLIYLPLIFGCNAAAQAGGGGGITQAAGICSQVVGQADALVQTSATYVTDPVNQQRWLQNVVSIFLPGTAS